LKNYAGRFIPQRLAAVWLEHFAPHMLHEWDVSPAGTEGYEKAEVTLGGVSTDRISSKTFEAKDVPGLYFVGEVLDVTGHLGGYNFQWAWASGYAAGEAIGSTAL
jgi:hypothetical protein